MGFQSFKRDPGKYLAIGRGPYPKIGKRISHRDFNAKPLSQKVLNTLRKWAVPAGKVLNPYGIHGISKGYYSKRDDFDHLALRKSAMRRKRLILKQMKAVALEHHELQLLARENATLAMQTLIEIARNPRAPEATRIAASAVILDRGYGKASQTTITANVGNGKNKELTGSELDRRIDKALKRVEELTIRTGKTDPGQNGPVDLRKLN